MIIPQFNAPGIDAPEAPRPSAYEGPRTENKPTSFIYEFVDTRTGEALDPEIWNAIQEIKNSDLGAHQQTLMLDVMRAMLNIRKQNMDLWDKQGIASLKAGLLAAQHQRAQGQQQAITTIVTSAATITQSSIELGVTTASAIAANKQSAQIVKDANELDWTKSTATNADGDGSTPRVGSNPPPYSETDLGILDKNGKAIDVGEIPNKNNATNNQKTSEANTPAPEIDEKAKAQYIADKQKVAYSAIEMKTRIAQSVGNIIGAVIKSTTALSEINASAEQAEATIMQAVQNYLATQSQYAQQYAQEIQQYVSAILEYIRSAENARHQASSSIANAV